MFPLLPSRPYLRQRNQQDPSSSYHQASLGIHPSLLRCLHSNLSQQTLTYGSEDPMGTMTLERSTACHQDLLKQSCSSLCTDRQLHPIRRLDLRADPALRRTAYGIQPSTQKYRQVFPVDTVKGCSGMHLIQLRCT